MPQTEHEILAKAIQRAERLLEQLTAGANELNSAEYEEGHRRATRAVVAVQTAKSAIQNSIDQLPTSQTKSPS
ncbi:MAG TPA: hypothetical protein VHD56_14215 [Tepidisphaeraceae bacterium]|nr:hypothetical protein [Tepidisphaeraceae bacterium]